MCSKKKVESLDNRFRKKNIIIDCLPENPQENLRWEIEQLCTSLAPQFEIECPDSVYRKGAPRNDSTPRRVFTSFTSQYARDFVMANSYKLHYNFASTVKLYLNEDYTDETKRKRNDIHKYVDYMKERNHQVEKKGEAVIVNGKWYSHEELKPLPPGQRLSDSRKIYKNGVVAFQSEHSPLSNLFPCQIKINGTLYNSSEQAYQHQKATVHNDSIRAARIMKETSPYEIMNIAREIPDSPEWRQTQKDTMISLIK